MSKDYSKYCFLPINYSKLIEYYYQQRDAFWSPQEINFTKDRDDWVNNMNPDEKRFITFILAFFAQADGIVIENLVEHFQAETSEFKEIASFYTIQNAIETIHNETYSTMIETFIQNLEERQKALNAIDNYPSIQKIAEWMFKWMKSDRPLLERVIAFVCVEGILFSGAFCAIYYIKKSNRLRGLCKANEFIARDEGIHTNFGIAVYHHYTRVVKKMELLEEEVVHKIIKEAMEVAESFIRDALHVELIGMSADEMIQYVRCTADWVATSLAYEPIYNVENPFDWMELLSMQNKTNFFEDTVSEYSKTKTQDFTFTTEAYF